MINGLWTVQFSSNTGGHGGGIVVFQNGKAYGGDLGYTYIGEYRIESGIISGEVTVTNYNNSHPSVFGGVSNFKLSLSGKADAAGMALDGSIIGQQNMKIGMKFTKRADIA